MDKLEIWTEERKVPVTLWFD